MIERQSILKLNAELDQAEKEEDLNRRMMQWERQRNLQLAIKAQEREEKIGHRDTKKISQVINYQKLELEDYVGCLMLEEQISEMMLNATQRKLDSAKKRTEVYCMVMYTLLPDLVSVEARKSHLHSPLNSPKSSLHS